MTFTQPRQTNAAASQAAGSVAAPNAQQGLARGRGLKS